MAARFFTAVDTVHRIYRANPVGRLAADRCRSCRAAASAEPAAGGAAAGSRRTPTAAEVHRQLLEEFAPPSVLVTADYDDHPRRRRGAAPPRSEGEPSHHLLQAIRPELQQEMRTAAVPGLAAAASASMPRR